MAAKQHGTAFLYGIDTTNPTGTATTTGCQLVSLSLKKSDRNTDKVHDNTGKVISERDDDELHVLTGSLRLESTGFNRLAISDTITITGGAFAGAYKITDTDEGKEVNGYVTYNFTAEKGEGMTYS